ncbi:MAG: THUMP domain-containing class I SAM-dependent RNA methyltransferase, partial [Bacteroidales bacterium]
MNTEKFEMVAKTFAEMEDVLAEELTNLGADDIEIGRRMVSFQGDLELMYKANLHCRTAVRILKPIAKFKASSTDQVYEQIKKIRWENYIQADQTFSIDATVYSEEFTHSKFLTYRAKDAIVDYFMEQFERRPSVRMTNADLMINLHVSHDQVTISLDSSGESLHKRGWRVDQTEAPLNEVLAAGMILKTGWRGQSDFLDPLCGSGTLLIEAAMIALNIPPGIYRKGFAFERWKDYNEELFDKLYNDESYEREFNFKIFGSDMSPRAISIAEENIKNAGVGKCIELSVKPLQDYTEIPGTGKCVIVTNPPYGERISSKDLLGLYENIGERLKHVFIGCETWILSYRYECFEKIGLRPSAKIKLMNGGLDCEFRKFEIFEGKRKEYKTKLAEEGGEEPAEEAAPITFKRRDDDEVRKEFAKSASEPREERRERSFGGDRGERSFGDRKPRSFGGDRSDRGDRS